MTFCSKYLSSRILGANVNTNWSSWEDISNLTNIGATSYEAIDDCQNLNDGINEVDRQKPKRGRPKKKVVQHCECICLTPICLTSAIARHKAAPSDLTATAMSNKYVGPFCCVLIS